MPTYRCPGCGGRFSSAKDLAGRTVRCPSCGRAAAIPAGPRVVDYLEEVPFVPSTLSPDPPPPPEPEPAWPRRAAPHFRCPYCGCDSPPVTTSQMSAGGWVLFVFLLLLCFPLCALAALVTEETRHCAACGSRLG